MKTPKVDTSGTKMAQEAAARAQEAANNLNKNFKADLSTENLTDVVAGGTADAMDLGIGGMKKRKPTGGLSSSLGII